MVKPTLAQPPNNFVLNFTHRIDRVLVPNRAEAMVETIGYHST